MNDLDKIKEKIKKLYALTESPNLNEASLAAIKAQELLDKYDLKIWQIKKPNQHNVTELNIFTNKRTELWKTYLLAELAHIFDCMAYKKKNGEKNAVGFKEDIEILEYTYSFLEATIYNLYKKELEKVYQQHSLKNRIKKASYEFKHHFCMGASEEIIKKIRSSRSKKYTLTSDGKDIVLLKKDSIDKYFEENFKNKKNYNYKRKATDLYHKLKNHAYNRGKKAGREIVIKKGIKDTDEQYLEI